MKLWGGGGPKWQSFLFIATASGLADEDAAFGAFAASLQTYYDAAYYVDWCKVWKNIGQFNREFHHRALLSSLCDAADIVTATRELLRDYPRVVCALPALLACGKQISILENVATAHVEIYDFTPKDKLCDEEIERYTRFIGESGLLHLLSNIKSVPDYVTGVEVGRDTNGRKNRSGATAVRVLQPHLKRAVENCNEVEFWEERNYAWLIAQGCPLPPNMKNLKWDGAFYSHVSKI